MLKWVLLCSVRVQEVFPGSGRLLGIQVDNNYISLPGELFENLKRPGIAPVHSSVMIFTCTCISTPVFVASFHFKNISSVLPEGE